MTDDIPPKGPPRPATLKDIAAALAKPELKERFAKSGARLIGNSPEEFAKQIVDERKMGGEIIKAAGITPN